MIAVNRLAFLEGLKTLKPVIRGSGVYEILTHCLIESGEGVLRLTGTNLEQTMRACVPAEGRDDFFLCVPHGKLLAWAAADWAEEIEIEVLPKDKLALRGMTKLKISTLPASHFPTPAARPAPGEVAVALGGGLLAEIRQARRLSRPDEQGAAITVGVHLWAASDGKIDLAASWHGYSLWVRRGLAAEGVARGWGMTIGLETVELLGKAGVEGLSVTPGETHDFFEHAAFSLWVRKPAIEFNAAGLERNMERMRPENMEVLGTMGPLLAGFEAVAAMCEKGNLVIVKEREGIVGARVMAGSDVVEAEAEVDCAFPDWQGRHPELALEVLRQVDRVARDSSGAEVSVGGFGKGVRIEVCGAEGALAVALLSSAA